MEESIKTAALYVVTPECYDQYFINYNFLHGECMKSTISKLLGILIVAGSITVKVPQIMKIINNKSGVGISLIGATLDLTAIASFFLYGYLKQYPFSSWGEGLFLLIQTLAVIGLIYYYQNSFTQLTIFLITFTIVMALFLTQVIPLSVLWVIQFLNLPIIILGKGMQAFTNYKNQSTGQLSAITSWIQFGGATARVFTSIQETGDLAMVLSFICASILNGIIAIQFLYYGQSTSKKTKGKGKGKGKGNSKGKKSD